MVSLALPMLLAAAPADAAMRRFSNCAALNNVYPHGVARAGARDQTKGEPVTNFTVNNALYAAQPKTLDRDKDGIACEKQ
jgi:hypothetical protein